LHGDARNSGSGNVDGDYADGRDGRLGDWRAAREFKDGLVGGSSVWSGMVRATARISLEGMGVVWADADGGVWIGAGDSASVYRAWRRRRWERGDDARRDVRDLGGGDERGVDEDGGADAGGAVIATDPSTPRFVQDDSSMAMPEA